MVHFDMELLNKRKLSKVIVHLLTKRYWTVIVTFAIFFFSLFSASQISRAVLTSLRAKPVTEAVLSTTRGEISIRFRGDVPKTVENFIALSQDGFYDKTRIHRVINNFMIEGGDPLSKFDSTRSQWGKGGPGYIFPDEISDSVQMKRGVVAMANSGPDTNGSIFFILAADAIWLNQKHTIFADVTDGMDVVDAISLVPVGVTGIPLEDIEIKQIELK